MPCTQIAGLASSKPLGQVSTGSDTPPVPGQSSLQVYSFMVEHSVSGYQHAHRYTSPLLHSLQEKHPPAPCLIGLMTPVVFARQGAWVSRPLSLSVSWVPLSLPSLICFLILLFIFTEKSIIYLVSPGFHNPGMIL